MRHTVFFALLALPCQLAAEPLAAPSTLPGGAAAPLQTAPMSAPATQWGKPPVPAPVDAPAAASTPNTSIQRVRVSGQATACDLSPGPRKVRLLDNTENRGRVFFLNDSENSSTVVQTGQFQVPVGSLSPGSRFTLVGECLGASGQVEMEWVAAGTQARADNGVSARLKLNVPRHLAQIQNWDGSKNMIEAVVPAIGGVPPGGRLLIQVRSADGESLSNAVYADFWPDWVRIGPAQRYTRLVQCAEASAVRSACRGGGESHVPGADYNFPVSSDNAGYTLAGAHTCEAPQGCKMRDYLQDHYRLDVPAWTVPVITRFDPRNTNSAGYSTRTPHPTLRLDGGTTPSWAELARPKSWTLSVNWLLEGSGESAFYRTDIEVYAPAGMGPALRLSPEKSKRIIPDSGVVPTTRTRMKDLLRKAQ